MLNSRQIDILSILKIENDWVKGSIIANRIGVTTRTIRSDIEAINTLCQNPIKSCTRKGYRLDELVDLQHLLKEENQIPQTPEDRIKYIIYTLLFKKDNLSFYELTEKLFVSNYTIESDIRKIRKMLESYPGLELIRKKNCIYFQGNEYIKRKFYRSILNEEIRNDFLDIDHISKFYSRFDLVKVLDLLENTLNDWDYQLRQVAVPMIVVHLGVNIERMLNGGYLGKVANFELIISEPEYKIAEQFYKRLSQEVPINVDKNEIASLAALLLAYKNVPMIENEVFLHGELHYLDKILEDLLDYIYEVFDLDFSQDVDFINGFKLHLQSLILRLDTGVILPNHHLSNIKINYPFFFEMSVLVTQKLQNILNCSLDVSEVGFIALHLGAAYERQKEKEKYKVLLIASNNNLLTQNVYEQLNQIFSERIRIVEVVNYYTEKRLAFYDVDFMVSLIPNIGLKNVPYIEINSFLTASDVRKIFETIENLDLLKDKERIANDFSKILQDDFFVKDLDMDTPTDIIHYLCDLLIEKKVVENSFRDSVFKREAIASTSFTNGIALPHPLKLQSKQSVIAVGILEQAIQWGDNEVELVMMLAIAEQDRHLLETFFDWFAYCMENKNFIEEVKLIENKDDFITKVLSINHSF